jgi:hypothetical protein
MSSLTQRQFMKKKNSEIGALYTVCGKILGTQDTLDVVQETEI